MNDPIVFLSKKGKKMQNAQIQIGEDEENDNHEKELIENNINEKEKQENLINDELNNIDAENIISNDEEDINLNEKENEKEQNQEEQINNENNDNNTLSTMNYNQLNLIKSHLKLICDKIEQGLNNYHKSKEISKEKNDKTLHNSLSIIEIKPLTKQINHYKQQTENIENELKEVYNINKVNELESNIKKCEKLKSELLKGLSKYPIRINSNELCVPQIVNFSLLKIKSETFVHALERYDVYVSTTTACSSLEESTVLKAISNGDKSISTTSIRVSLSPLTTHEEIQEFLEIFDKVLNELLLK
jgi:hypothetical protein